jgi:AraC family transcriptional regulator
LSAFSKSFSREFGISPSDYRINKESYINSCIDYHIYQNKVEKARLNPKIRVLPIRLIAYVAVKGRYGGAENDKAWKLLEDYAVKNKLLGWNPDIFSIYYDDPEVVGVDNCNFDCCIAVKKKLPPTDLFKFRELPGGKYLVLRYKGPYEKLWELYDLLYHDIISIMNNTKLRDAPVIEKYIKYSEKTKPKDLVTEIYIPIV